MISENNYLLFPSRLNLIQLHGNHLINHIYTEKLTNQREANKRKPAVIVIGAEDDGTASTGCV